MTQIFRFVKKNKKNRFLECEHLTALMLSVVCAAA